MYPLRFPLLVSIILGAVFFTGLSAGADESLGLFTGLSDNLIRSFKEPRFAAHLGAIGSTIALSSSGVDARVEKHFADGSADTWANPAAYAGFALVPVLGGGTYLVGQLRDEDRLVGASFAVLQSSLITLTYVTLLKTITGRPNPSGYPPYADLQSRQFKFGLGREGILYGWPSGHTAVTAAALSSIAAYYDSPELWVLSAVGTAYMGLGMTAAFGATQHWFSDVVAGALIGYSIGSSVGEGFRQRRSQKKESSTLNFYPVTTPNSLAVQVSFAIR